MNSQQNTQEISATILEYATNHTSYRQLAKRLVGLLPARLKAIKSKYRHNVSSYKAERLALLDKDYLGYIDEIVNFQQQALLAKVQWETHFLLFEARRSQSSINKKINKKK